MDKIVETYDITLRSSMLSNQLAMGEREMLGIIQALDDIGITYIGIGTPGEDEDEKGFYAALADMQPKNSKLVPYINAKDCEEKISENATVNRILNLGYDTVCVEGECSDYLVREDGKLRPDENIWRISGLIAWLKSRGKMVIFNAANLFDAFESNNGYARDVLKSVVSAGADRIVLCDSAGFALSQDIFSTVGIVAGTISKKLGIACGNNSGCADANAIAAVRSGVILVQGSFLGTGEYGNINLVTAIGNLQMSMGYRCIQELKLNRLTLTAEYIAEQMNTTVSYSTPFIGKHASDRKSVCIPGTRSAAVLPEMVGNTRKAVMNTIDAGSSIVDKLRILGYKISREQIEQMDILSDITSDGYVAEASVMMRILRAIGRMPSLYEIESVRVLDELIISHGYYKMIAIIEVKIGDEHRIETGEANSFPAAAWIAIKKALQKKFPCVNDIRIHNFHTKNVSSSDKSHVFADVNNGEISWSVSSVSDTSTMAFTEAMRDAIDYQLMLAGYYKK